MGERNKEGAEIFNEKSRLFFPSLLSLFFFFFLLFLCFFLLHVKELPLSEPSLSFKKGERSQERKEEEQLHSKKMGPWFLLCSTPFFSFLFRNCALNAGQKSVAKEKRASEGSLVFPHLDPRPRALSPRIRSTPFLTARRWP